MSEAEGIGEAGSGTYRGEAMVARTSAIEGESERENEGLRAAGPAKARPAFRPAKRRWVGRVLLALLVVAVVGGVAWFRLRPKAVVATEVVRGAAIDAVYATGTVEAHDRVDVKAKVAGSIAQLVVREGARVKKGDLLATIDSPTLKYELEKGKADQWAASQQAGSSAPQAAALDAQMQSMGAQLKDAKDDEARLQALVAGGSATQSDLDKAKNRVASLGAQLAALGAQKKALMIDLSAKASGSNAAVSELAAKLADTEVRSPLDGVVLSRSVELGEVVMINENLFKVGDDSDLILECSVDEADIGRVKEGSRAVVSLYAYPKQAFDADVFEILPDADRSKKAFVVKLRLKAPPQGLRSGMSAEVNVIVDEHAGSLLLPTDAIDANDDAWVVNGDRVEKRHLKIGIRDMLRVEVLDGLKDGDVAVTSGVEGLTDGARVKVTMRPQDPMTPMPKSSTSAGGSL